MLLALVQVIVILLLPGLILYVKKHSKIVRWLSPIVTCYLVGILAGNLSFLSLNRELLNRIAELSVCLAIPILLFSSDVIKWLHHSRNTFISFSLALASVVIASLIAFFIFRNQINDCWKVAGMLFGVYTGATVNMTAIGIALEVDNEVYVLLNSADLMFGGLYFFFLISLSKKVFGYFLPVFKADEGIKTIENKGGMIAGQQSSYRKSIMHVIISLLLSMVIFAISAGISYLIAGKLSGTIIILIITALGIAFSFNKKIHALQLTYESGNYLLLVFAITIGSMVSFSDLITANLAIVLYCAFVVFGSALLHVTASSFFKLEDDIVIINSAAAMFGPAFILPVAEAIKNKPLIVPGLAMALLGNAIGTYLGLAVAWSLNYLF